MTNKDLCSFYSFHFAMLFCYKKIKKYEIPYVNEQLYAVLKGWSN